MFYLTIVLLLGTHTAAFFAGAHNAKRALAIKAAAKSAKDAISK